jgi:hypothetical protein
MMAFRLARTRLDTKCGFSNGVGVDGHGGVDVQRGPPLMVTTTGI